MTKLISRDAIYRRRMFDAEIRSTAVAPKPTRGPRNKSRRGTGVTELIRFNLAWYAMNAIFSRKAIMNVLGHPTGQSELEKFGFLYGHAKLSIASVNLLTTALHTILDTRIITRIAGYAPGTAVTTLEAIVRKYTPTSALKNKTGKLIHAALSSNNLSALHLPTLIYLMRNWIVHGSMMDSGFGSKVRFEAYIGTVLTALAEVHIGVSKALLGKL